jgi:hypothetical protein
MQINSDCCISAALGHGLEKLVSMSCVRLNANAGSSLENVQVMMNAWVIWFVQIHLTISLMIKMS